MRRVYLLGILCVLYFTASEPYVCAQESADTGSKIVIRAGVTPEEGIVVGQRVLLHVDVLAPDGWAQIKHVRDFSIVGAQVVRYESQGTRLNETISGQAHTGQRYQLSLFPGRGGMITVPSIPVVVEVSSWGSKGGKETARMQTPEVTFQAEVPPGAEGVSGLISTTGLTASQKWDPGQQELEVGQAVKRIIELNGKNISGMAFSPLAFDPMESVSIYPGEPVVNDTFNRGALNGKRIETVTYVFEKDGTVELPEITIPWWDIENKKLQQTVLAALKLEISPSPVAAKGEKANTTSERQTVPALRWITGVVVFLIILLVPATLGRGRIRSWWNQRRQLRREAEAFYFRQFSKASRTNDPAVAYNSIMHWLDRIHTGPGAARLDEFLLGYGDSKSAEEAERIAKAICGEIPRWSGASFYKTMGAARSRWQRAQRKGAAEVNLPALNP